MDKSELIKQVSKLNLDGYHFFLRGFLSQWYWSLFSEAGRDFCTAEQYMMFQKAQLFGDDYVAEQIMGVTSPSQQKKWGRQVSNFDPDTWNKHKVQIVYQGSWLKFSQNEDLKEELLNTRPQLLVEANPKDPIWSCGLTIEQAQQTPIDQWPGENLLGQILTLIRSQFK